jgi:hypothetical protein
MSKKLPAIQFYPGDWHKDIGVQSLCYHDKGVWFEILLLMFESEQRGVLLLNGAPMPEEQLAWLLRLDNQTLNQTLTNILKFGVASRNEATGALYCRRMVRDEEVRKIHAEAGKKGGNPALVNQTRNQNDSQKPTPSSSSSISTTEQNPPSPDGVLETGSQAQSHTKKSTAVSEEHLIEVYQRYPRREDRKTALPAIGKAIRLVATREKISFEEARQWLLVRLAKYNQVVTAEQRERKYIKQPATWFNQGSYDNEDLQPAPPLKSVEELCDLTGFDDPKNQWQPMATEAANAN